MFSGDRSHSVRPRLLRPRPSSAYSAYDENTSARCCDGSVGQRLLQWLAGLHKGWHADQWFKRSIFTCPGDGSEVVLLVGWPRGG